MPDTPTPDLTAPEHVEAIIERLQVAYGGVLSRDCKATLRALTAERDALRAALEYYASDVGNGDVARTALSTKTPPG